MRKLAKQTKKSLNELGAKEQINSGAIPSYTGDGIINLSYTIAWGLWDKVKIEHKATENKSFSVTKRILNKIISECNINELPVLQIQLIDKNKKSDEFIILRKKDFKTLLEWTEFLQSENTISKTKG